MLLGPDGRELLSQQVYRLIAVTFAIVFLLGSIEAYEVEYCTIDNNCLNCANLQIPDLLVLCDVYLSHHHTNRIFISCNNYS